MAEGTDRLSNAPRHAAATRLAGAALASATGVEEAALAARLMGAARRKSRRAGASLTEPPVMTWGKAAPIIVVAVIFDALRFMCDQAWFFGPALAALYCTAKVSGILSTYTFGLLGTGTAAAACVTVAGVVGAAGVAAVEAAGTVLALAIGLLGWLTVTLFLVLTDSRIFKTDKSSLLWLVGGLFIAEVPFINMLPGLTGTTIKLFATQIRKEKAAHADWARANAARLATERAEREREALLLQQQIAEQEAAAAAEEAAEEEAEAAQLDADAVNAYDGNLPGAANDFGEGALAA